MSEHGMRLLDLDVSEATARAAALIRQMEKTLSSYAPQWPHVRGVRDSIGAFCIMAGPLRVTLRTAFGTTQRTDVVVQAYVEREELDGAITAHVCWERQAPGRVGLSSREEEYRTLTDLLDHTARQAVAIAGGPDRLRVSVDGRVLAPAAVGHA